jgi:signal transduction histidine kinase
MSSQHDAPRRAPVRRFGSPILDLIMLNRDLPDADQDSRRRQSIATHATRTRRQSNATTARREEHTDEGRNDPTLPQIAAVIEALPEPIILTDDADRVVLANPSADALFSDRPVQDRRDLLSRFEIAAAPPQADVRRSEAPPAEELPADGRTVTLRLRQEPNRWFSIESFALGREDSNRGDSNRGDSNRDDLALGGRGHILRDVTEAQELEPEREAFLAIMSHELRTPITTIYAGSSVLAHSAGLSRPASHSLALDISAEAARLYDLVEDLIVIARLERHMLEPLDEPILLQRVADVTARVVASRAPDISFVCEGTTDPPPVRGDSTYVEQAARDLALAAARFGGEDRTVALRVEEDEATDDVVFRVVDNGPPLTPVEEARIFDLRSGSTVGRLGGSGLGPFVARHLVEAMNGRTWARNRSDGGVELAFALPADRR